MYHVALSRLQKVWTVAGMASISVGLYAAIRGDEMISITTFAVGLMMSIMAREHRRFEK